MGIQTIDRKFLDLQKEKIELEAGKAGLEVGKSELAAGKAGLEVGKSELAAGQSELAEGQSELEAGQKEYERKIAELRNKEAELTALIEKLQNESSSGGGGESNIAEIKKATEEIQAVNKRKSTLMNSTAASKGRKRDKVIHTKEAWLPTNPTAETRGVGGSATDSSHPGGAREGKTLKGGGTRKKKKKKRKKTAKKKKK